MIIHIPLPICITLHLEALNFNSHVSVQFFNLSRSCCKICSSSSFCIFLHRNIVEVSRRLYFYNNVAKLNLPFFPDPSSLHVVVVVVVVVEVVVVVVVVEVIVVVVVEVVVVVVVIVIVVVVVIVIIIIIIIALIIIEVIVN